MWADRWVGTPFAKGGRGPEYDCYGLFLALQRERFGREIPDLGLRMTPAQCQRGKEEMAPFFRTVEAAREGDALLFRVSGEMLHVGYALDGRDMLHIEGPAGAVIEDWRSSKWRGRLEGIYRVR